MRKVLGAALAAIMLVQPMVATAQDPGGYAAPIADKLETRTFPLLAMMRAAEGWDEALRNDPILRTLTAERASRLSEAPCTPVPRCLADSWTWTGADIAAVAARLRLLVENRTLAASLVTRQIRKSGRFARYGSATDADLLTTAWTTTAAAMNQVIAVYARGEPPRYPKIDAMIFDVARPEYAQVLTAHGVAIAARSRAADLFFDPAQRYAAGLLRMNERTDAASHRPLLGGENTEAVKAVAKTDWRKAPYGALLVFGHGPEDPVSRTGVMAHIRLGIAADLYARGVAPFVIVSGGNVHPNRTPFNEAVEMKRLLVSDYGIPADRILIEPHARHTTTNLRNCARLLLAAAFPTNQPALVVSDHQTIAYIASDVLTQRNRAEIGVQPGKLSAGPSRFTLRFDPDPVAFHADAAADPLDP